MPVVRRWLRVAIVGVACAACIAAAPPPVDREGAVAPELVVTARIGGPAWWRVSSTTSTVYVMGVPGALPKGLDWDASVLDRRLVGANMLIGTPAASVHLGDLIPIWSASRRLKSDRPMEDGLPPDLRDRFDIARTRISHNPNAYSNWTPVVASLAMFGDYRKQSGLDPLEPAKTIERLARRAGVKVKPSSVIRILPIVRAAETEGADAGPTCLDDALREIEAGPASLRAAADGWAKGDVASALKAERGYERCLSRFPAGDAVVAQTMTDATNAIVGALAQPGHSVAIVNLRTLLAQGGVLQQLQNRGFKVATPNQ